MTDTDLSTAPRRRGGLTGMVLADLRGMAAELGVPDTTGMRKGDLIVAIKERQGGGPASSPAARRTPTPDPATSGPTAVVPPAADPAATETTSTTTAAPGRAPRTRRGSSRPSGAPEAAAAANGDSPASVSTPPVSTPPVSTPPASTPPASTPAASIPAGAEPAEQAAIAEAPSDDDGPPRSRSGRGGRVDRQAAQEASRNVAPDAGSRNGGQNGNSQNGNSPNGTQQGDVQRGANQQGGNQQGSTQQGSTQQGGDAQPNNGNPPPGRDRNDENEDGSRSRRGGRRFRERRRGRDRGGDGGVQNQSRGDDRDVEISDDDVLQPVAGILDVLDNYAFVRTSGYLPGSNDVYVAMNMVRKNGLRRGDAVTGAVRIGREGENPGGGGGNRQKFNPLVRIDTINGGDVEAARKRPDFTKLTPLYPNQRLRLETTPNVLTTRVIDLVMPIGKGQRALIVSPPKAGKTSVLQAIANAIAVNNPECHLMVVLVDERPEEVTDMQRSVRGEVISSTFDRPPGDHTTVAELAIERAKRLVESGKDVVVLLDSITRLGRAYNNSSPASGRILSGGVDSTALYPPKRFLGAARNIENGGSLTIIATAMVETGSTGDTVIFEEFKGTGNAELKLDRKIAERRVFPAVDVNPSGTRKDELLMNQEEYGVALKLRRVLSGLDSHQAIDLLIDRLRKSGSNAEFMMQVAKTSPAGMAHPDES